MILRVGDAVRAGRAVDLPAGEGVTADAVAEAVRTGTARTGDATVEVWARTPGALHDCVGAIPSEPSIRPRTALAVAARSRGWRTPVDARLAAARVELAALAVDADDANLADRRRAVAEASSGIDRLRERVAEARGRLASEPDDATPGDSLEAAVGELADAETTAAAARESLAEARTRTRATRDRLEARLRLADEVGNLRRTARACLVERAEPAYRAALAAVPGLDRPADPFEAPPDAMALAVARVGALSAPVVLSCGRFPDASAAARWLDAPAIRLSP